MKEIILHIKSHPDWKAFEKYLLSERPTLPVFDPKNDNSALWRQRSGERNGYDRVLAFLNIKLEN